MRFQYLGPSDAVDITVTVGRGQEVDLPDADQADRLLEQPDTWVCLDASVDDLTTLHVPQLRELAAERGVDLTGVTRKPDIIARFTEAGEPDTEEV